MRNCVRFEFSSSMKCLLILANNLLLAIKILNERRERIIIYHIAFTNCAKKKFYRYYYQWTFKSSHIYEIINIVENFPVHINPIILVKQKLNTTSHYPCDYFRGTRFDMIDESFLRFHDAERPHTICQSFSSRRWMHRIIYYKIADNTCALRTLTLVYMLL